MLCDARTTIGPPPPHVSRAHSGMADSHWRDWAQSVARARVAAGARKGLVGRRALAAALAQHTAVRQHGPARGDHGRPGQEPHAVVAHIRGDVVDARRALQEASRRRWRIRVGGRACSERARQRDRHQRLRRRRRRRQLPTFKPLGYATTPGHHDAGGRERQHSSAVARVRLRACAERAHAVRGPLTTSRRRARTAPL
jgi:hypothetical protein